MNAATGDARSAITAAASLDDGGIVNLPLRLRRSSPSSDQLKTGANWPRSLLARSKSSLPRNDSIILRVKNWLAMTPEASLNSGNSLVRITNRVGSFARPRLAILAVDGQRVLAGDRQQPLDDGVRRDVAQTRVGDN